MSDAQLFIGALVVVALVTVLALRFRPFRAIRRSGDDHESGAWKWIGADHRRDTDRHSGHESSDSDGGDSGAD